MAGQKKSDHQGRACQKHHKLHGRKNSLNDSPRRLIPTTAFFWAIQRSWLSQSNPLPCSVLSQDDSRTRAPNCQLSLTSIVLDNWSCSGVSSQYSLTISGLGRDSGSGAALWDSFQGSRGALKKMLNKYSLTTESLLLKARYSIGQKIIPAQSHASCYPKSLKVRENPLPFDLGEPPAIGGHAIRIRPASRLAGQRGGQHGLAR
jgi:hypothetical protein